MTLLRSLLLLLPALLQAQPGTLLPSSFPDLSSHATVTATSLSDDGSFFLAGDFQEIDGIPRPGLAKLSPDGTLDTSFTPASGAASGLFALPTGHLMLLNQHSWSMLDPDGSPNSVLFPDLPKNESISPQYHHGGRHFIIAGTPATLRAYRTSDFFSDSSFVSPITIHPPYQAVPAADSKLWLLTRSPSQPSPIYYNINFSHTLLRLLENGTVDPSFTPLELPAEHAYSLESAPSDGFRLIGEWLGRYNFWPRATNRSFRADQYNFAGEKIASLSYAAPFSWSAGAIFQDTDLVIYPTLDSTSLVRRLATTQTLDPSFSVPITAPAEPIRGPLSVVNLDHLPSGTILLGGTRRLLPDGSPDPRWHIPRISKNATISHLRRLPDGSVLAIGNFDLADGSPAPGILKLRPDDTPDPSFTPAFDFRFAKKILPFPDGSLLALFNVLATDQGQASQLARFSATGEFLSLWPIPEPPGTPTLFFGEVTDFAIQSDGTTLVSTFSNGEVPSPGFRRILPDGTSPLVPGVFLNSNIPGSLLLLHDDSYLRGNTRFAPDGTLLEAIPALAQLSPLVQLPDHSVIFARQFFSTITPPLVKWHPHTGLDPAFEDPFQNEPSTRISAITPAAHGKLIVQKNNTFTRLQADSPIIVQEDSTLVRLHATGQVDPTFRPPSGNLLANLDEPGGSLLIAGDFTTLDGQPREALARLADTRAIGFTEWIAATTARSGITDLARDSDPDHDGSSNFFEYAAGTDPTISTPSQPTRLGALTWMMPCNPEAPEINRRLETSTGLDTWIPARADQVRLETNRHCLTWTLLPGLPSLFSRVRID